MPSLDTIYNLLGIIIAVLIIWGILTKKITPLEKEVSKISKNLSALLTALFSKKVLEKSEIFISESPIKLTTLGEEILQIIGGKNYIDKNEKFLISEMRKVEFKSALDVENYSVQYLMNLYNTDEFTPIKDYIYLHPIYKKISLDLTTITRIMSIYLRDKYFEKYQELNI